MLANDWRNYELEKSYISHSWGKKPEQKEAERKYNHEYYMKHKKKKSQGKKPDEQKSDKKRFTISGFISDLTKTEKEEQIADVPCNVLIYNEDGEVDGNGEKYIAKVKINGEGGKQYWKYFYTEYQIQTYQNLVNKVTDNRDNSSESDYLNTKGLDEIDRLLLQYDLKREPTTPNEDAMLINPNYDENNPNTSSNCIYCSEAYCMRRMGFDVVAAERETTTSPVPLDWRSWRNTDEIRDNVTMATYLKDHSDTNPMFTDTFNKYNSKKLDYVPSKDHALLEEKIKAEGDGACGSLNMFFEAGSGDSHSITFENRNGITYYRDVQNTEWPEFTDLSYYADYVDRFNYIRLDNQLPDAKGIETEVKSRKGSVSNEKVSDKDKYKPGLFEKIFD